MVIEHCLSYKRPSPPPPLAWLEHTVGDRARQSILWATVSDTRNHFQCLPSPIPGACVSVWTLRCSGMDSKRTLKPM